MIREGGAAQPFFVMPAREGAQSLSLRFLERQGGDFSF